MTVEEFGAVADRAGCGRFGHAWIDLATELSNLDDLYDWESEADVDEQVLAEARRITS